MAVVHHDRSSQLGHLATTILHNKNYSHSINGNRETWTQVAERVVTSVVKPYLPHLVEPIKKLIEDRKLMPGGRYLYAAGRKYPQLNSCFLFKAEDSREGWGKTLNDCCNALMTGGGIGVVYTPLRPEGQVISGLGGQSTGPLALMKMVNECGRYIIQGGSRRSAIWAGLHWNHPDIFKLIGMKDWSDTIHNCRREDFNFPAPMDGTNISVILDDLFFQAYNDDKHSSYSLAQSVYWESIRHMLKTGEPGFSIDIGDNDGENLRNACCEVCSSDNGDLCNLSSINLGRVSSIEEFAEIVELGMAFLLCGTLYSKLPLQEMYKVREKNRRLGLGLMGLHDWLLRRGYHYKSNSELKKWMEVFIMSDAFAHRWADKLSISRPVATRSIAPTGTISIIAETTSGIEPIFASAYKRRYLEGKEWKMQYKIDAAAQRLVDSGVDPELIEDSYTLSEDVERRIELQSFIQQYVNHGVSSTINLPEWGSSLNNESKVESFGKKMMNYLPSLRGITVYPNGSRGGQPLVRTPYSEAIKHLGKEYTENSERDGKGEDHYNCSSSNKSDLDLKQDAIIEYSNENGCKGGVCGT